MSDVRVLVVDDQEPFRRAMAAVVEETEGFAVIARAGSGEQSLDLAATVRPDLVLMDVNLPGIDGIEATRRLTATAPAPVVVLLSTYDEDELAYAACGATAYVPKAAFGPDRLRAVWTAASATRGDAVPDDPEPRERRSPQGPAERARPRPAR